MEAKLNPKDKSYKYVIDQDNVKPKYKEEFKSKKVLDADEDDNVNYSFKDKVSGNEASIKSPSNVNQKSPNFVNNKFKKQVTANLAPVQTNTSQSSDSITNEGELSNSSSEQNDSLERDDSMVRHNVGLRVSSNVV